MKRKEITVSRGETISLSWRRRRFARYIAEEDETGVITLTPAESVHARLAESAKSPLTGFAGRIPPCREEIQEKIREMPLKGGS